MDSLSKLIFNKRKEAGLTQERLADLAGVNRITIRRYEQGDFKSLDFYQLHNISKVLSFNLLTFLEASCEGLTMNSYDKLSTLYHLVTTVQKSKVQEFLSSNINDDCFKSSIGNELYCYVKALLYHDSGKVDFSLRTCSLGLEFDVKIQKIPELKNKSILYLKLLTLSASCLSELGNIDRSIDIYTQIYDFIIEIKEQEFRNSLFYEDFFDFRIVALGNLAHLLIAKCEYKQAIKICNEAIKLMFENNAHKYLFYLLFNKAQALYNLRQYSDARRELLRIYYFYIALSDVKGMDSLKELIKSYLPDISDIIEKMKYEK